MASAEDIMERKRAQEALELAAKRFELVSLATQDALYDWDLVSHEIWRNENYQRLFGAPGRSFDSDNWWVDRLHPEDRERVVTAQKTALGSEDKPFLAAYRLRRPDGSYADIVERSLLVRDAQGQVVRMIGALTEVSERKRDAEALRELSGRLLRLQDEERRRIARELHDTTAQRLGALAMNLSAVKDSAPDLSPRARACLSESLELAGECSREIRTLSYLLHPPLLDEVGLGSALRWFVDGYTQRTGIDVQLEMPPQLTRLPEDIELALYRVVQEGLTNIHHHSRSKKAHICLMCRPAQALLTVADEGCGLPPGLLERGGRRGAKLGVGISGMRERIRQLGGQFEIVSGSNGTTLKASVPLGKDRA